MGVQVGMLMDRTLARLIAKTADADFKELSATRWVMKRCAFSIFHLIFTALVLRMYDKCLNRREMDFS